MPWALENYCCAQCGETAQEMLVMNLKMCGAAKPNMMLCMPICGECKTHKWNEIGKAALLELSADLAEIGT